jgi:DNA-binding NtrC family response regulator
MHTYCGIVQSKNPETVTLCAEISEQLGMTMTIKQDVANFLLDLQEGDYRLAIFDCDKAEHESLKWVKFIRNMRPKLPLIVLCEEIDKKTGAQMYEEGIFYLGLHPLDRESLFSVFEAVLKQSSQLT